MLRRRPAEPHRALSQPSAAADVSESGGLSRGAAVPSRPWTNAERGLLADLTAQECRVSDIAAGLGRTVDDCRQQLDGMHVRTAKAAASSSSSASRSAASSAASPSAITPSSTAAADDDDADNGGRAGSAAQKPWRLQDDLDLVEYVATHGPQWKLIAERHMPGRSPRALMRRWALVESLMMNASAVSHLDGLPAATPPSAATTTATATPPTPQINLRSVLQQHHDASRARRGSAASSAGSASHQRVAAALLGGRFPAAPPSSPGSLHHSHGHLGGGGGGGSASSSAGATSFGFDTASRSPSMHTPAPRSPRVGCKRSPGSAVAARSFSPPLQSARTSAASALASAGGPLSGVEPATAPHSLSPGQATPALGRSHDAPPFSKKSGGGEMTGDDIVNMVTAFVERHALDSSAAASGLATATAAPDSDEPRRAAGGASARRTGAAIAVAEQQQRAAAASSVAEVMAHLELHRPHEQTQRVALELSHQNMSAAATRDHTSNNTTHHGHAGGTMVMMESMEALLSPNVLGMDCDEGAEVAAARHRRDQRRFDAEDAVADAPPQSSSSYGSRTRDEYFDNAAARGDDEADEWSRRGARGSLRPPDAEEIQTIVAMHIQQAVESSSLGAATASTPAFAPSSSSSTSAVATPPLLQRQEPPVVAAHNGRGSAAWLFATPPHPGVASLPVAGYDDDGSGPSPNGTSSSTLAKASTAAFLASWANLEMSGAFGGGGGGSAWSNVFEPQRCVLRSAVPRALAFLPCVYLSCTGGAAAAGAVCAGGGGSSGSSPPGSSAAAFGDSAASYTIRAAPPPATSLTGAHGEGRASLLCPVHVANRFRNFAVDMRDALMQPFAAVAGSMGARTGGPGSVVRRAPALRSGNLHSPAAAFL